MPRLWEQLPKADKRLFLRHFARYWEVHRHRVAPETARRVAALASAGPLRVHRGYIAAADDDRGVRVRIDNGGSSTELAAGWLLHRTCCRHHHHRRSSLRHLLDSGLARPDKLRLGLDTDARGALRDASGRPASDIIALGLLLRGRWYETTAIPEIRDQAAALARHLLTRQVHAGPGSAA